MAGNGARAPRARALVRQLAAALNIPVVTTPLGKGVLDERDDLCLGPTGRNGTYAVNKAARTADVILALGTRFDDRGDELVDPVSDVQHPSRPADPRGYRSRRVRP